MTGHCTQSIHVSLHTVDGVPLHTIDGVPLHTVDGMSLHTVDGMSLHTDYGLDNDRTALHTAVNACKRD
jgi:hypothetical protein